MENEENQNQVSLRFPPPLEIAPRFPHFHNPDDDSPLPKTQNQKTRKEPQRLKKPQPPSSGSSFDEKMLVLVIWLSCHEAFLPPGPVTCVPDAEWPPVTGCLSAGGRLSQVWATVLLGVSPGGGRDSAGDVPCL